ncbi:BLUF domain-containing protein [Luteimonas sp. XNQY3]|nr:BLUF domain-containing protein [Luteimonas sp. XNQY3]MCD9006074.1 BLUF domain-containing protein [Luteimonas sp. XNQY3]
MIRQLLYRSGQLYEFTVPDMVRLLLQSRTFNARHGIGGMLLLRDGLFMQLLEGPAAAVDALYARIASDPRHCEVRLMVRAERTAPLLPGWRMGWSEAPLDGEAPVFHGLETDTRALALLESARSDRVAAAMRDFLHGAPVPGGGLGCARVMERVL